MISKDYTKILHLCYKKKSLNNKIKLENRWTHSSFFERKWCFNFFKKRDKNKSFQKKKIDKSILH